MITITMITTMITTIFLGLRSGAAVTMVIMVTFIDAPRCRQKKLRITLIFLTQ